VLLAAGLLPALAGCGALDEDGVRSVASAFADPAVPVEQRCALLAPGTRTTLEGEERAPCAQALPEVPLGTGRVEAVEVWGEEAQARLADDTLFLTRTRDGWRVSAGACRPQGEDTPYDCRLEGS
jgi:hypothetical protein